MHVVRLDLRRDRIPFQLYFVSFIQSFDEFLRKRRPIHLRQRNDMRIKITCRSREFHQDVGPRRSHIELPTEALLENTHFFAEGGRRSALSMCSREHRGGSVIASE